MHVRLQSVCLYAASNLGFHRLGATLLHPTVQDHSGMPDSVMLERVVLNFAGGFAAHPALLKEMIAEPVEVRACSCCRCPRSLGRRSPNHCALPVPPPNHHAGAAARAGRGAHECC